MWCGAEVHGEEYPASHQVHARHGLGGLQGQIPRRRGRSRNGYNMNIEHSLFVDISINRFFVLKEKRHYGSTQYSSSELIIIGSTPIFSALQCIGT